MIIYCDKEAVQQRIFDASDIFERFAATIVEDPIIQMSADRYLKDLNIPREEKLKCLFYSDVIICMHSLGHTYHSFDYESMPLNLLVNKLDFPNVSWRNFVDDPRYFEFTKEVYDMLKDAPFVEDKDITELNLPKILERTPYYENIDTYYKALFLIAKTTAIVDNKISLDEFVALYQFSKFINIDNL